MNKVKIFSINGNTQLLDGGSMFGNAPRVVWEKWTNVDELGRIELACRSLLIQYNGLNILLEAGIGQFFEPKLADRYGVTPNDRHLLKENIEKLGILPSEVDFVILSHLHFDHIGGIVPGFKEFSQEKKLLFSNAKFITSKIAYERALAPHPRDNASFISDIIELLNPNKNLILIDDNIDFPEKIKEIFKHRISNGHTPGQLLTTVKGLNESITFCGDLIPGIPWVHLPITMGYDRYPELLIDEKKEFYQEIDLERNLLFFTHDIDFCAATISRDEKGKYRCHKKIKEFKNYEL
jgi:glyoxylase-like metal-dependent hydrolase (beta-lactamase superfamily II)